MREAVRVEKAQPLLRLVGDVGRVQASAGTRAALDGLRLAEGPRDMPKLARLATAKGGKTRAILKLVGRSAIVLALGAFDLSMWLFWALVTLLGFVASLKRMTEESSSDLACAAGFAARVALTLSPSHSTASSRIKTAVLVQCRGKGYAHCEYAAFSARRRGSRISR